MSGFSQIPVFRLFGETAEFPGVVHHERIRDRALLHDWRISPHRHREIVQILHMENGHADVQIDGEEFALKSGEIVYVPVQAVHGFLFRQGAEGGVFSFPLTLVSNLPSASADLQAKLSRPLHSPVDKLLKTLLSALDDTFHQTGTFQAHQLATLAQSALVAIASLAAKESEAAQSIGQRRMSELDALLRHDLNVTRSIDDYAHQLGITAGHLNRICREATGTNAGSYIEAARMVEASRLLAFTQLSIGEIGYRLGYDDPPYFSRRFRQVIGKTPSQYRAHFLT